MRSAWRGIGSRRPRRGGDEPGMRGSKGVFWVEVGMGKVGDVYRRRDLFGYESYRIGHCRLEALDV